MSKLITNFMITNWGPNLSYIQYYDLSADTSKLGIPKHLPLSILIKNDTVQAHDTWETPLKQCVSLHVFYICVLHISYIPDNA